MTTSSNRNGGGQLAPYRSSHGSTRSSHGVTAHILDRRRRILKLEVRLHIATVGVSRRGFHTRAIRGGRPVRLEPPNGNPEGVGV